MLLLFFPPPELLEFVWVNVFSLLALFFFLGFQHQKWKASVVQKQKIQKTAFGFFEIISHTFKISWFDFDARLKLNVGRFAAVSKKTPS